MSVAILLVYAVKRRERNLRGNLSLNRFRITKARIEGFGLVKSIILQIKLASREKYCGKGGRANPCGKKNLLDSVHSKTPITRGNY